LPAPLCSRRPMLGAARCGAIRRMLRGSTRMRSPAPTTIGFTDLRGRVACFDRPSQEPVTTLASSLWSRCAKLGAARCGPFVGYSGTSATWLRRCGIDAKRSRSRSRRAFKLDTRTRRPAGAQRELDLRSSGHQPADGPADQLPKGEMRNSWPKHVGRGSRALWRS
jgi:hypothetical protein